MVVIMMGVVVMVAIAEGFLVITVVSMIVVV